MTKLKEIKVIYCYCVCFSCLVSLAHDLSNLTCDFIFLNFFYSYKTPYSLQKDHFKKGNNNEFLLEEEERENMRLNFIEKDKKMNMDYETVRIFRRGSSFFYVLLILLIHILIIRHTNRKFEEGKKHDS
jgi:hypothetical protein